MSNPDLVESFSGIRGLYGQSITEDFAYNYALAFCRLFHDKHSVLVVGGDSRNSTASLKKAMIKAFFDFGIKKVIDVGLVPVQVCEFSVVTYKASGGVYITASHNEPEYNGWKFLKEDGAILYKHQANKLIQEVKKNEQYLPDIKVKSTLINKNVQAIDHYVDFVIKKIGKKSVPKIKKSNFKILADPNGGSSVVVLEKLFKRLGVKVKIINKNSGVFFREVAPNSTSLAYLQPKIRSGNFQFACGFDCDADRVEFVLQNQMISGQYVLALACDAVLSEAKGQMVPVNDATSYLVRDVIKKYGAKLKEVEVGETNVVSCMEQNHSIIGGEGSNGGVIVMPIKCRDGIMTTALMLKLMADKQMSLQNILSSYPRYYSERTEKQCSSDIAIVIQKNLERYFTSQKYIIKKTGGITGGLKILFDNNSYLWFRLSKTEPGTFRIIADGNNAYKVKKMLLEGSDVFDRFMEKYA